MRRRKFLMITGLGALAAGAVSVRFISVSFHEAAVGLIQRELGFLKLDHEGVRKFVNDFSEKTSSTYRLTIRGYSLLRINSSRSGKVHQLVTAFLLSSDFFQNKMDETRLIKYVALYDPYKRPCAHPFSALHYT